MTIRRWHYGKLILLWAWGGVALFLGIELLAAMSAERFVVGTILVLALLAIPVFLSVVTWKWLGGKEAED